uniref:Putative chemosensory protein n=1 Tax=Triatoma brasiliensis TaxID=65344 RepID=A0A163AMY3_TRIBS|nr:putative chemosensory protein [Triatoma brasiliensis]
MKSAAIIVFLLVICAGTNLASTYTTKYDNIDLDEILSNERIYVKYYNCLLNKSRCTPDGKELKENLPDALQTACDKCSEKQKQGSEKVLRFILEHRPQDYLALEEMYDPQKVYRHKYEKDAKERGLKFPD